MSELPYDSFIIKELIKSGSSNKEAFLQSLIKVKFIDRETSLKPHEFIDRIELSNIILDNCAPDHKFIASLYFTCLVRHTSLFFF